MTSFLQDILTDLSTKNYKLSELTFILPSRRAGTFLKSLLPLTANKTIFSPDIKTIETFVEDISNLKTTANTELLFELYTIYLAYTPENEADSFETFCKWGNTLLQDFNEIDRYLIPQDTIFDYLKAIKEINSQHWSLSESQTPQIKKYLSFWNRLKTYYTNYKKHLLQSKKGYQGLVYRMAVENLSTFISKQPTKKYVFVGFNALNNAEQYIIKQLLSEKLALIYWDIEDTFINNPIHDAGYFARQHKTNWNYFNKNPFNWITNNYTSPKSIKSIGVSKNIGQVKHIGEILYKLHNTQKTLQNTAIVLADETLLIPLLQSLPIGIGPVNITMGLPLSSIPLSSLFEEWFKIQKQPQLYYKEVIMLLSHQYIKPLFEAPTKNYADNIIKYINTNNIVYIKIEKIYELAKYHKPIITLLLGYCHENPAAAIDNCIAIIYKIKDAFNKNKSKDILILEYLYRFNEVFNELKILNKTYTHIKTINTLKRLYKELLANNTLDFKGEPLQGLQIMGMLESRVLDYETVIITSVNEGILPAGKSNHSFIPYDVKLQNGLPTYKEKDAVYTYHFYRLLHRAKDIYLLYNTDTDVLIGGEKSRLITQLEVDKTHAIESYILTPKVPKIKKKLQQITKTPALIDKLRLLAAEGFSPSSLTTYIRNPIDFYYQKILKIKPIDDVEEAIAFNTLGTVVHNVLEEFYKPYEGEFINAENINALRKKVAESVDLHFKLTYKEGNTEKGKNLIIKEIAKRYINNFLDAEIETLLKGHEIKIIAIEKECNTNIRVPGLDFPIHINGKIDRVDLYNDTTRIIDYKTGRVEQNYVEVVNWEDLTTDYNKYSKSFQVLTYVYLLQSEMDLKQPIEAGIISFKNLNSGVIKFAKKNKMGKGATKETFINESLLSCFIKELETLILEIFNPEIPFTEKEIS